MKKTSKSVTVFRRPNYRYPVIYSDPPWELRDKGSNGAASNHYQTMKLTDLKAMPVADVAARDAVLFMWVLSSMLPEALELGAAWGFKPKTKAFTWVKVTKTGAPHFGLGRWTRAGTEDCLLFVRGKPYHMVESHSVRQVVTAPVGRHSEKPPEVAKRIVELIPSAPRLEMFCREKREGWDSHGNEIDADVAFLTEGA